MKIKNEDLRTAKFKDLKRGEVFRVPGRAGEESQVSYTKIRENATSCRSNSYDAFGGKFVHIDEDETVCLVRVVLEEDEDED